MRRTKSRRLRNKVGTALATSAGGREHHADRLGRFKYWTCALALFVILRRLGRGALSFAQRRFLVLLSLFFFASSACRPVSFGSISAIIYLECHRILRSRRLISRPIALYM